MFYSSVYLLIVNITNSAKSDTSTELIVKPIYNSLPNMQDNPIYLKCAHNTSHYWI